MFYLILFPISLLAGITALIFFILGLINNKKQQVISGAIVMGLSLILFFFTLFNVMESYFRFIGHTMVESNIREQSRYEDDFASNNMNFADTLRDDNDSTYILLGIETISTNQGATQIAFYEPTSLTLCLGPEIFSDDEKQISIILSQTCAEIHADKIEVYNSSDVLINSSVFVQIQPFENGESEIQYILRKPLNGNEANYIIFKYE
ncbi:MAG: hypothetical protein JXR53_15810 [Bacteroidales bacterium]|nr:hypothetical protein [Bacteroidales bacterium]